jgi:two-component system, chemotaxis family, response regulator Rcp1
MRMLDADRCLNILLVEDNSADVDLTLVAFRDALVHSHISVVTDGEEAIAFLKRTGNYAEAPSPDLVLLDLNLPKINGLEVLEAMKTDPVLKIVPVIVMSGSDREEDQARAYRLQAAAYLVKPPDKDKYFAAIRSVKELWFHSVTPAPKTTDASS